MKSIIIIFVLSFLASCKSSSLEEINPISPVIDNINENISNNDFKSQYMLLVNDHRRSLGLKSLNYSVDMESISNVHAINMAKGIVSFGHGGFSERCDEAQNVYPSGNLCAEIVAMGPSTPQGLFNIWMNSSGHKAKIESPRSTHTGLGFSKNSSGKTYYSELFLEVC
jgi:uncharacterized protein YkwD